MIKTSIVYYGRYYATTYTIASLAYLTGIPIGGMLMSKDHGSFEDLTIFVGICYVGALAALVLVRVLQTRWRIRVVY